MCVVCVRACVRACDLMNRVFLHFMFWFVVTSGSYLCSCVCGVERGGVERGGVERVGLFGCSYFPLRFLVRVCVGQLITNVTCLCLSTY